MSSRAALRWAALGGMVAALLAWAPAGWLGAALERADGGRLLLREPAGSWHDGSARLLLAAPGVEPQLLGGRLHWRLGWGGLWRGALGLELRWDGVADQPLRLQLHPQWAGWRLQQLGSPWQAAWPAAALQGLGAPWNSIAPRGVLRLRLQGLALQRRAGATSLAGQAQLDWVDGGSRLSPLPALGSYRLQAQGRGALVALQLDTLRGPLLVQGAGSWGAAGLRFAGSARAAAAAASALDPLLGLIGRWQGDHVALQL